MKNTFILKTISLILILQTKLAFANYGSISRTSDFSSHNHHTCAVLYEHEDFQGQAIVMRPGESISNFKNSYPYMNDRVSSVDVSRGCAVTMYQHIRFGGFSTTYWNTIAWVGDYQNDQFSSATCYCR